MKYIFMGKINELMYFINTYNIKDRIQYESEGAIERLSDTGFYYPDIYEVPSNYYIPHVTLVRWKEYFSTETIEYRIEVGALVKIKGNTHKVKKIEVNDDGTVTCYTDHVIRLIETDMNEEWAKNEVIKFYSEEKARRINESSQNNHVKKGFWSALFGR